MGLCDTIPGISGGTIAFITGIYVRLIEAVNNLSLGILKFFGLIFRPRKNKKEIGKVWESFDLVFLASLFAGIILAILLGSRFVKYLLENYFAYMISFFIGLILASSKIIFDHIRSHKFADVIFSFFGLVVGLIFSLLMPLEVIPTLPYVFLGGVVGISAMFLPGISGAFILLIMGIYHYMISQLHEYNWAVIITFMGGVLLGAALISRTVSVLFCWDKNKTLYFLLGLVIGTLGIPVRRVIETMLSFNFLNVFLMILLLLIGVLIVFVVNLISKSRD